MIMQSIGAVNVKINISIFIINKFTLTEFIFKIINNLFRFFFRYFFYPTFIDWPIIK